MKLSMLNNYTAVFKGIGVAVGSFAALGTVAALWENPFFFRMVPAGGIEISLLASQALLLGVYVAAAREACVGRPVGVGSVFAFLGVACPVCNQILMMIFGAELLMVYFEPIRVYVAALGVVITAFFLWHNRARLTLNIRDPLRPGLDVQ